MNRRSARVLALCGLAFTVLVGDGCEGEDRYTWVAPADINGTWVGDSEAHYGYDPGDSALIVEQSGSSVAARSRYENASDHSWTWYSGAYELQTGLLTLWSSGGSASFYRFTSDTVMYSVENRETDVGDTKYEKQ